MQADVYFIHDGEFIPAMVRRISFSSERGLKQAIRNVIRRSETSLHLQYGSFQHVRVECMWDGNVVATAELTTW